MDRALVERVIESLQAELRLATERARISDEAYRRASEQADRDTEDMHSLEAAIRVLVGILDPSRREKLPY